MNNYRKGKNVEEPLERTKIPIPNLPENFLWMQVRGGSKIRNLLSHALNEFPEVKHVVWTGFGTSVGKAITCAEIMKREFGNSMNQINKICYRTVEEFWDPIQPELVPIVVKRKLPMIHIYLSSEIINEKELGYQGPGSKIPYKQNGNQNTRKEKSRNQTKTNMPKRESAGMSSRKNRNQIGNDDR